jgi:hypothetical protein
MLTSVLVAISALAFVPYTAVAVPRFREIRTKLETELADRSPDYPMSDVKQAVLIGVIGMAVVGLLLVLAEIRAVIQLRRKRRGARTWLLILAAVHVPLIALTPYVRDGGRHDAISAAVQGGCLVLAVFVAYLPPVTRWLNDIKRQGPIPLRPSTEAQA